MALSSSTQCVDRVEMDSGERTPRILGCNLGWNEFMSSGSQGEEPLRSLASGNGMLAQISQSKASFDERGRGGAYQDSFRKGFIGETG